MCVYVRCVCVRVNDDENWNYDIGSLQMVVILNDMDQQFLHSERKKWNSRFVSDLVHSKLSSDDNDAQMASDQIERVYFPKMNKEFQKPVARLQLT